MTAYDNERRIGFDTKLNAEANAVLNDAAFLRSPVLSKLLRYLVDETIRGNGDALKSYSVAVDGLGRPETFDSASDSSARVQMVRLRKALESYYAQHGPTEDLCLYFQPGSYKVRAGKLSSAYPQLYRPLSEVGNGVANGGLNSPLRPSDTTVSQAPNNIRRARIIAGVFFGILIAVLAGVGWQQFVQSRKTPLSPILEIIPVEHADTPALNKTAQIISSSFANDLPRFNIAQVRVVGENSVSPSPDTGENVYSLSSRIEEDAAGGQRLFLRLSDAPTGTAFWSHEAKFETQPKSVAAALVSLTADISGPFGVIAAHGSMLYRDRNDAGYACLLKYFSFVESRAVEIEDEIAACLGKPVKEQRLKATMLAARALFTIERSSAMKNFDAATDMGIRFARASVEAGPNDASSNFAMARFSYLKNDCISARFYTRRAVEANANNPLILANLAALAPVCGYPDAAALLDRAFLAQSPRYPRGRLLLTLAALQQGQPKRLAEIKPSDVPQSPFSRVNYFLTETLIAGTKGDRELTAQNWKQFVAAQPSKSRNPDEILKPIVALRPLRVKLIKMLADAGAFEGAKK